MLDINHRPRLPPYCWFEYEKDGKWGNKFKGIVEITFNQKATACRKQFLRRKFLPWSVGGFLYEICEALFETGSKTSLKIHSKIYITQRGHKSNFGGNRR